MNDYERMKNHFCWKNNISPEEITKKMRYSYEKIKELKSKPDQDNRLKTNNQLFLELKKEFATLSK